MILVFYFLKAEMDFHILDGSGRIFIFLAVWTILYFDNTNYYRVYFKGY